MEGLVTKVFLFFFHDVQFFNPFLVYNAKLFLNKWINALNISFVCFIDKTTSRQTVFKANNMEKKVVFERKGWNLMTLQLWSSSVQHSPPSGSQKCHLFLNPQTPLLLFHTKNRHYDLKKNKTKNYTIFQTNETSSVQAKGEKMEQVVSPEEWRENRVVLKKWE